MRSSLLISPYFPPVGVSGTKRALHLVRNLPVHGWKPVVLTGTATGEPLDHTLVECVPPNVQVDRGFSGKLRPWLAARQAPPTERRARTTGNTAQQSILPTGFKYWSPFDRYLVDVPAGYAAAKALIERGNIEVIHVSADPWSSLIIADRLTRSTGIPLVVDFRDPWSLHAAKMAMRPPPTRSVLRRFEHRVFKVAAKVILNTESAKNIYVDAYDGVIPADRFTAVRNAFDEGLFLPSQPIESTRFTVLYFGRFRQFVSPDALLRGYKTFIDRLGLKPEQSCLKFVGGLSEAHHARVRDFQLTDYLEMSVAVPFRESLSVLQSANVLALVIEPDCRLQIPGKLYDYLAARRPILAVSANDEANRIIASANAGRSADHADTGAVADALHHFYRQWRAHEGGVSVRAEDIEPFSARRQACHIAQIYNEAVAR
ncbi:MAG: glycosyltransferase [Myxococcota bacterium]|nr:glycosyltransferase [Myxococcota bacterium]